MEVASNHPRLLILAVLALSLICGANEAFSAPAHTWSAVGTTPNTNGVYLRCDWVVPGHVGPPAQKTWILRWMIRVLDSDGVTPVTPPVGWDDSGTFSYGYSPWPNCTGLPDGSFMNYLEYNNGSSPPWLVPCSTIDQVFQYGAQHFYSPQVWGLQPGHPYFVVGSTQFIEYSDCGAVDVTGAECAVTPTQGFTPAAYGPVAVTNAATNVQGSAARLNGMLNGNNLPPISYYFQYGLTVAYGSTTPVRSAGGMPWRNLTVSEDISGLSPNTLYHCRIVVTSSPNAYVNLGAGHTSYGGDVTFTTPNTPSVQTFPAADVLASSATLNGRVNPNGIAGGAFWAFEYGTAIGVYPYTTSGGTLTGSSWTNVALGLSGLTPDTDYYYRIKADSANGSSYGGEETFHTQLTEAPSATTGSATNVTMTTARLNGTVNPHGQATTYRFEYGLTPAYGSTTAWQTAGSGSGDVAGYADVSGLAAGTLYNFRIVAQNPTGTGYGANATFTTQANQAPTATTNAPTLITNDSVMLNGTAGANGVATQYWFEYGLTTAYGSSTAISSAGSDPAPVSVSSPLGGLSANTTYHARLVVQNGYGIAYGLDVQWTTAAAPAPGVQTDPATGVSSTTATLRGMVDPNGLPTTYVFEYGLTVGYGSTTPAQAAGSGTGLVLASYGVTGLTPNTLYHYRVVATNPALAAVEPGAEVPGQALAISYGGDMTFTTAANPVPSATTGAAINVTESAATLTGTVNANGVSSEYRFNWGATVAYGNNTPWQAAGSGTNDVYVERALSGLAPGSTIHFRVQARNSFGTSDGADMQFTTGSGSPPTVTTGGASSITYTTAMVDGVINPNGSGSNYLFRYGTDPILVVSSTTPSAYAGSGTGDVVVSRNLTGLPSGATIHYRIEGTNTNGSGVGVILNFATPMPAAPSVTTEAATGVGYTGAILNGIVNVQDVPGTYLFRYGLIPGGPYPNFSSTGNISGSTDQWVSRAVASLSQGTTYYVVCEAANAGGTTVGNQISFTTQTAAPGAPIANTLDASNITTSTATLNGTYNPQGLASQVWFDWDPTASLGNSTGVQSGGSGSTETGYSRNLTGLTTNTTYYFQMVCSTANGTARGNVLNFTTQQQPNVYVENFEFKCAWVEMFGPKFINGSGKRGSARKSVATLRFTGTGVSLYSMRDKTLGKMKLTINGASATATFRTINSDGALGQVVPTVGRKGSSTIVNLYTAGATQFQAKVYQVSGLTYGVHTLKCETSATKAKGQKKKYAIFVDAAKIE